MKIATNFFSISSVQLSLLKLLPVISFLLYNVPAVSQTYFQQEVNYTIHASLDDVHHFLSCNEQIVYKNNSPDTLHFLYFHLWPNAYKDESTALAMEYELDGSTLFRNLPEKDKGYIDSLEFNIDGRMAEWTLLKDTIDICKIILPKPLMPSGQVTITTPFRVKIPSSGISRLGHDKQAYYVSQWYPKPAVYDRNGWNIMSYQNQGEFYSEFGNFEVFITLPENYIVGTTGILMDEEEKRFLEQKVKETQAITTYPDTMAFPTSSSKSKTLHFFQERVHDFAWFADKRYHVLREEIVLPDSTEKVEAWVMFTNANPEYWLKAMDFIRASLQYYSRWIGAYPYKQITAADVNNAAGRGMEYPCIMAIGSNDDFLEFELEVIHEVGHNWFYGMLGSNERLHPWMDEGLTNFLETRYVYTRYTANPEKQLETFIDFGGSSMLSGLGKLNHRSIQYLGYLSGARKNSGQPPDTRSEQLTYFNYGNDVYFKTSISIDFLKFYLRDSLFDACLHNYFEEWKFRHPMPEDLKKSFESTSQKNLDWMFEDLIRTTKKIDYRIENVHSTSDSSSFSVTLNNKGDIASPLAVSSLMNGEIQSTAWTEGFTGKKSFPVSCSGCTSFKIDASEKMPELYRHNNAIRTKGLFKKIEPIRFQYFGGIEDSSHTQIFLSLATGWNNYNKTMLGAVFHNIFFVEKKFEYALVPLYSFGTQNLAGGGRISYHLYPENSFFRRAEISIGAQTYSYADDFYQAPDDSFIYSSTLKFLKVDSRLRFTLKENEPRKKIERSILLRNIFLKQDLPYALHYRPVTKDFLFFELSLMRHCKNLLRPSAMLFNLRTSKDLVKASFEASRKFTYERIGHGFDVRFFAGYIFYRNISVPGVEYRMQLSGNTGKNDYLFDEVFLGRTERDGILSRQFDATDGGFVIPTFFYRMADKWMTSLKLKTSVPGILPIKLFANIGTFNDASDLTGSSVSYEAGIELILIKDIFTIYFPFAYSKDLKYIVDNEELKFGDLIRFELHLHKMNPATLVKQIEF